MAKTNRFFDWNVEEKKKICFIKIFSSKSSYYLLYMYVFILVNLLISHTEIDIMKNFLFFSHLLSKSFQEVRKIFNKKINL